MESNEGVTRATKALMSKGIAPDDDNTWQVIMEQDVQEPPAGEAEALREEVKRCREVAPLVATTPKWAVREVVEGMDTGAAMGPSPWGGEALEADGRAARRRGSAGEVVRPVRAGTVAAGGG